MIGTSFRARYPPQLALTLGLPWATWGRQGHPLAPRWSKHHNLREVLVSNTFSWSTLFLLLGNSFPRKTTRISFPRAMQLVGVGWE